MEELVTVSRNEAVCTSLQIADSFSKRHSDVLEKIEKILSDYPTENSVRCFKKSTYVDSKCEKRPMYYINRDGFAFLVMGFTGKKALEWKWKYIEAFNKMEELLRERNTEKWIEVRENGKLQRKAETDVIKELIEYAKEQGSEHSDKLYLTYTKLANMMSGVGNRDKASAVDLTKLTLMEHIIFNCITEGMLTGRHYKEIYQSCKNRLISYKEIAYLN